MEQMRVWMEREQSVKPFFFLMDEKTFRLVIVQLYSAAYTVQLLFFKWPYV